MIEEFCATISNNESIWYATNIEIARYLKALRELKFSVDRKYVYNPFAFSVWIDVDLKSVEIRPGEVLKLLI